MSFSEKDKFKQNHGVEGVVYVLENPGLKTGLYKIGHTRHSGAYRADQLNIEAGTGTPGIFRCIFEQATFDCGRAEEGVKKALANLNRGKFGQEFFEVNFRQARETIIAECARADTQVGRYLEEDKKRQEWLKSQYSQEKTSGIATYYTRRPWRRSVSYRPHRKWPRWRFPYSLARLVKEWVWIAALIFFLSLFTSRLP